MPAWLLAAALVPAPPGGTCRLARAALRDIAVAEREPPGTRYLDDQPVAAAVPSVFPLCPDLLRHPPPGWRVADAVTRAALRFPRPGDPPLRRDLFLWSIGRPDFAPDGRSATIAFAMACPGLCGHGGTWRYCLTTAGWRSLGTTGPIWVS